MACDGHKYQLKANNIMIKKSWPKILLFKKIFHYYFSEPNPSPLSTLRSVKFMGNTHSRLFESYRKSIPLY